MKFTDPKKLQAHLDKRATTIAKKNVVTVVTRATMMVERTVQESIKQKGTGRTYSRAGLPPHIASAAGDPPATDEGFLGQNITMNVTSKPDGSVVGQVISASPYSKALEFGTVNMQPRPFMQPAFQKNKNKIFNLFKKQGIIK